ncbi:hypothetical protein EB118_04565 [bacterium]|nr:hypothetical protein [bacterium]NBX97667.1 hypothetical protein [bacterium]NDC94140.1 hypothetical protein [bacterium]NDD83137.1 hypothetical protein [bacterium]NDG29360.1 hypothetical protein [bacterium]
MMHVDYRENKGFMTVMLLMMISVFAIITVAVLGLININTRAVANNINSQKAFNIAEAGINYYLWHLSHSPTDFKDGQTTPTTPDPNLGYGPYVHTYKDDNSITQGTYTLWLKPQGNGSTVVTIRSIGQVNGSSIKRSIDAKIGSPSFASYGVVSDTALWFGDTESASGPVHSNQGVRMDGPSSSDVTSANATYIPSSQLGGNGSTSRPGVWCSTAITTPVNCNTRSKADWRYPVPSVDFNQVNGSLCTLKKTAFEADSTTSSLATLTDACTQTPTTRTAAYLPQRSTTGSYNRSSGYLIELNTDGTYNLYNVNNETDTANSYTAALTRTIVGSNIALPSSKVLFAEDNVWVRTNSTFSGRVTIGAGRLATASNAVIVIADDVVYSTKNGSDAIGLVAEDYVTVAPYAPPQSGSFNFEIDAAVIAQTGSVLWPLFYRSATSTCTRGFASSNQNFLFYGSVASRQSWTWTWAIGGACGNAVNSGSGYFVSGILNNTTQYDYNLLYAPPPSFPITSSFNVLSWQEVITAP